MINCPLSVLMLAGMSEVAPSNYAVSPLDAGNFVRTLEARQELQTGSPVDVASGNAGITDDGRPRLAQRLAKNDCGRQPLSLMGEAW